MPAGSWAVLREAVRSRPASPLAGGPPLVYLQVGAFAERGNADATAQKLAAAGVQHAFILPVAEGMRTLYKVRVGPVPDVDAVDALSAKLTGLGFPDAQIVIP